MPDVNGSLKFNIFFAILLLSGFQTIPNAGVFL